MTTTNSEKKKQKMLEDSAERTPHYGYRKLSAGVASVLLSTTLWMGEAANAHAATENTETANAQNSADASQADAAIKTDSGLMIQKADATDAQEDQGQANDQKTDASVAVDSAKSNEAQAADSASQQADAQASADGNAEDAKNDAQADKTNAPAEASAKAESAQDAHAEEKSTSNQQADASAQKEEAAQKQSDAKAEANANAKDAVKSNSSASGDAKAVKTEDVQSGDANSENVQSGDAGSKSSVTLTKDNDTGETSVSVAKDSANTNTLAVKALTEDSLPLGSAFSTARLLRTSFAAAPATNNDLKLYHDSLDSIGAYYYTFRKSVQGKPAITTSDKNWSVHQGKDGSWNIVYTRTFKVSGPNKYGMYNTGDLPAGDVTFTIKDAVHDESGKKYDMKVKLSNVYFKALGYKTNNSIIYNGKSVSWTVVDFTKDGYVWFRSGMGAADGDSLYGNDGFGGRKDGKIGTKFDVTVQVVGASTNNSKNAMPIYFRDLDQPDKTEGGEDSKSYLNENGDVKRYTEKVQFLSGMIGNAHANPNSVVKEKGNTFYGTQVLSESDADKRKGEFDQLVTADKFSFHWAASDAGTRVFANYGDHEITTTFVSGHNQGKYTHTGGNLDTVYMKRNRTVTVTPNSGYYIKSILVDGKEYLKNPGSTSNTSPVTMTFNNVTADHNVKTDIRKIPVPVTPPKPTALSHTVKRTIHYVVKGGTAKAPADKVDQLSFNGTKAPNGKETWDPNKDFADVASPAIKGYNVDRQVVSNKGIAHDHADIYEVVTYTPATQNLSHTVKRTIHYVVKGGTAQAPADKVDQLNYTATKNMATGAETWSGNQDFADVVSPELKGYNVDRQVVSNKGIGHDHADIYEVVTYTPATQNLIHTVKRTIHYVVKGGRVPAPADRVDQLNYTATKNMATGAESWSGNQDFADVTSPAIKGYTVDRQVVSNKGIAHDHADIYEVVTYTPDIQKLDVTYHDDTANKDLKKDEISGESSTVASKDGNPYTTESSINSYKGQGYELVSDDTGGKQLIFDDDASKDQHFVVHLKHGTSTKQISDDVNRTINYKMSDGSPAPTQVKDSIHFNGTQTIDNVTKAVTNTTWEPNKDFADVNSPAVKGYTPDRKVVSDKNVAHDHADIVENVVYTPDPQKATVVYIDKTTGDQLRSDSMNGVTHGHSGYTTKDKIKHYEDNGYKLVSDDTKGNEIIYDDDPAVDQHYTVYLEHTYVTVTPVNPQAPGKPINPDPTGVKYPAGVDKPSLERDVNRTINYKMSDGSKAPAQVKDKLHFTDTKVFDKVTGKMVSEKWSPNQDFADVNSPAVKGYTPDRKVVSDKNIAHDHDDIVENVVYTPDPQKAKVTYIDQTTGKTLKTDDLNGVSNAKSGYTTKSSIQDYEDNGYALVSDDTKGDEIVYDDDDAVDQSYTVVLKHTYQTIKEGSGVVPGTPINKNPNGVKYPDGLDDASLGKDVKRDVTYRMSDGTQAPGPVDSVLHFTAQKVIDKVTGEVLSTEWSPAQDYDDVVSPEIKGYTPDQKVISDKGITHEHSDIHEIVTYDPNPQKATVTYVDETTGKTITVKNLAGKSNGHSGYTTAEEIQALKNAGYVLVSDDTGGSEVVFDDDDSVDQAYVVKLAHRIDNSEEKHTATRTIRLHNPDGTIKTIKQVGHVQRPVMTDAVTGKKTYGKWTTDNWDMFKTPQIAGYTPTLDEVVKKLVTGDTKDETVDIYYKKNPAPKAPEKPAETPKAPEEAPAPAKEAPAPQLPQTGNSKDAASLAAGTFAVGTSLLATVLKRRFQDKKQ